MSGDLQLREITIDPEAIDPEDAEMLAGHGPGRGQRGAPLGPGAGRQSKMGGIAGGLGGGLRPRRHASLPRR